MLLHEFHIAIPDTQPLLSLVPPTGSSTLSTVPSADGCQHRTVGLDLWIEHVPGHPLSLSGVHGVLSGTHLRIDHLQVETLNDSECVRMRLIARTEHAHISDAAIGAALQALEDQVRWTMLAKLEESA